jgi:hypothetical protein
MLYAVRILLKYLHIQWWQVILWFTYRVVLEEYRVPLILHIVEEGDEDDEQGDDDDYDDSQAAVYYSTQFHTEINLFLDLFLGLLD